MNDQPDKNNQGHRERLRQRFLLQEGNMKDVQLLELLLTYSIPRRDVAPISQALIEVFGSIDNVFDASVEQLTQAGGVGDNAAVLIKLVQQFRKMEMKIRSREIESINQQATLFQLPVEEKSTEQQIRTYANDEIANALTFLPQVVQFQTLDLFKTYLANELPYNAASTRQRRASYLIDRFYPEGRIDTPLTLYLANCQSQDCLKPILFYHILKAEPLVAKVAEEFIWPALPVGYIEREFLREFILRYLPEVGASSQKNILRSIFTTYDLLDIGSTEDSILRFGLHTGNLQSFLYVLTSEFPSPGTYSFQQLEQGVMYHWLLWHRDWMKQQLYLLRELRIISKVTEIDSVKQFTLDCDPITALRVYFSSIK